MLDLDSCRAAAFRPAVTVFAKQRAQIHQRFNRWEILHISLTRKKAEHWRIDAFELWCWRRLESPLDGKEIKPVNPKGNQPWVFIRGTDEAPILSPPDAKSWLIRKKTLMLGKVEGRRRRGWYRTRRLDDITKSMDTSLSKLGEMVKDREAWRAADHRAAKSQHHPVWSRRSWSSIPPLEADGRLDTAAERFPPRKNRETTSHRENHCRSAHGLLGNRQRRMPAFSPLGEVPSRAEFFPSLNCPRGSRSHLSHCVGWGPGMQVFTNQAPQLRRKARGFLRAPVAN